MTVAANLSMLFTELPPLGRFHAAKAAGFTEVEFLFPYDVGVDAIAEVLAREALSMVLINAPAGNWIDGERGLLADPRQEEAFWSSLETGLAACVTLNCHKLHVLGGCHPLPDWDMITERLSHAADRAAEVGVTLLLEPLNTRDVPGYYLWHQDAAATLIRLVNRPNLKLQMDLYHCQIMEGDLMTKLGRHSDLIGHIQIASVPQRGEPDLGEIRLEALWPLIEAIGCDVALEYHPAGNTGLGLKRLAKVMPFLGLSPARIDAT